MYKNINIDISTVQDVTKMALTIRKINKSSVKSKPRKTLKCYFTLRFLLATLHGILQKGVFPSLLHKKQIGATKA